MVSSTATSVTHTGNGVTTAFSFPYSYAASTDLDVTVEGAAQVLGTDYTVSDAGPADSCTITFVTAPAVDDVVLIERSTARTQLADYTNNDAFPAETHEAALDKLQMQIQELWAQLNAAELDTSGGIYYTDQTTPNGYVTAVRPAFCYDVNGGGWVNTSATSNNDQWYQVIG